MYSILFNFIIAKIKCLLIICQIKKTGSRKWKKNQYHGSDLIT